jgi:hypothetical protein
MILPQKRDNEKKKVTVIEMGFRLKKCERRYDLNCQFSGHYPLPRVLSETVFQRIISGPVFR